MKGSKRNQRKRGYLPNRGTVSEIESVERYGRRKHLSNGSVAFELLRKKKKETLMVRKGTRWYRIRERV